MQQKTSFFLGCVLLLLSIGLYAQNTGIGTTNPTQTLDVNGNLRVRGLGNNGGPALVTVAPDGSLKKSATKSDTITSIDPTFLGMANTSNCPSQVILNQNLAYVLNSLTPYNFDIFDVSNPVAPTLLSRTSTAAGPLWFALSGQYLYVANFNSDNLQVFDCANPAAPQLIATAPVPEPICVQVSGNRVYVTRASSSLQPNNLVIFDCTNPSALVQLSSSQIGTATTSGIYQFVVSGTLLYMADEVGAKFRIADVANPLAPVELSATTILNNLKGLALSGSLAYLRSPMNAQVLIYDCSNPSLPVNRSVISNIYPTDIVVNGSTVCIIESGSDQVQLYNCADPTAPVLTGGLPIGSSPTALGVRGSVGAVVSCVDRTVQFFRLPYRIFSQDAEGNITSLFGTSSADDLGDHTARQALDLDSFQLVGNGGSYGISISKLGYVGIGIDTANAALQFANSESISKIDLFGSILPQSHEYLGFGITGNLQRYHLGGMADNHVFYAANSANASQELARITATGRLGIGTANPTQALDVNGGARVSQNLSAGGSLTVGGVWQPGAIGQEAVQAPALQNDWVNYGLGFANAGFYKDKEGRVHLHGLIKDGDIGTSIELFLLPAGYRPAATLQFRADNDRNGARIEITAAGKVIANGVTNKVYLNLSGISFRAN
jgi:hypothetical protein